MTTRRNIGAFGTWAWAGTSALWLAGMGTMACGRAAPAPDDAVVAATPADTTEGTANVSAALADAARVDPREGLPPAGPVPPAPALIEVGVTREACEQAANHMMTLALGELNARAAVGPEEIAAMKDAMDAGREGFLAKCVAGARPEMIDCMLKSKDMAGIMACGQGMQAPGNGPVAMASEDECRQFVAKLDALALNGAPAPTLSPEDAARLEARKAEIVAQCAREAPRVVIQCSLAAKTIEDVDACHEKHDAIVRGPGGGDDHAGHNHGPGDGHDHGDHDGHDHGDHAGHDHGDHAGHDHGPTVPSGPKATEDECRAFTLRFTELTSAGKSPEEAGKMRKRMTENMDAIVRDCVRSMPQAVVQCGLKAATVDELMKCRN